MMSSEVWRRAFGIAAIGLITVVRIGSGQTAPVKQAATVKDQGGEGETRAQLEAEAKKAEEQHRASEAWILRTRLQKGDFQDGDRIVVKVLGTASLTNAMQANDTVTLRAGKLLPLPQMGEVPLDGVLRSELSGKVSSHIAKFLNDSSVRVTPLVRLAVLGQVRTPGYYWSQADVLLSEVVMKAGGPLANADVGNMLIRRDGKVLWNAQDTRTALSDGLTVDRLHLRAGDELYVDDIKGGIPWQTILQIAGPLLTVAVTLYRVNH
ncbi:MAG: SLBB domain-containing protein [bacterium]